jgi:aconitate hydratase
LRRAGVVDAFVEFFGPALARLSLPDRATVANMAPEYGATTGFFPVDEETIRFLRQTGRAESADVAERYCREQGLFRADASADPEYDRVVEIDLAAVEAGLAGPKRPQDCVPLGAVKSAFRKALAAPVKDRGYGLAQVPAAGAGEGLGHGAVVIAAITSCTNTSNPTVMLAAGLLARNAVRRGLRVPAHVKTSLAPGSRAVTRYLREAGVLADLEALGFALAGYGCMTCIGNSGPLPEPVAEAIRDRQLVAAAVLSGNRNFEGRIHPLVRANYLASPPLVVTYALAGTVDLDLTSEPIGRDPQGRPVFLRDLWPSAGEVAEAAGRALRPELFRDAYAGLFQGSPEWSALPTGDGDLYRWDPASTYILEPPFVRDLPRTPAPQTDVRGARVLGLFGDSVTTDHISPAGEIDAGSPAGRWLRERGVPEAEFHSYGARRGNDQVMVRGAFANLRLKNLLVPGVEGNVTVHVPSGERMSFFDAAMRYRAEGTPLLLVAGKEYGTGSSRDWAAKGTLLLGVRAVLAESFERIHRSNLIGMGVLPLQFLPGAGAAALGLNGRERYEVTGLAAGLRPRGRATVAARADGGAATAFEVVVRLDTPVEVETYAGGGILPSLLRTLFMA